MLSRVAESLYWMARYVERAEDLTRALAVHFQALLDAPHDDAERGWSSLLALTGDEEAFGKHFEQPDDAQRLRVLHPATRPTRTPSWPASRGRGRTPGRCATRSAARCGST